MPDFPHDSPAFFSEVAQSLCQVGRAVVMADPGAGKTTKLPLALLDALQQAGDVRPIWVLQPRRLAAKLAAGFLAQQLGEPVGRAVGYQVRHEQQRSEQTRLLFLTYGVFAQRLRHAEALRDVSVVLLDEFHERGWQQDAALAWLWSRQRDGLPAPRFGVLSATLESARLAAHIGDAPLFHLRGKVHALEVAYAPPPRGARLLPHLAQQALRLLDAHAEGHVLAFLPGQRDIEAAVATLTEPALQRGAVALPLYARLPPEHQARALAPAAPGSRKLILATNIAESSVTIDGVRTVLDGGQAFAPHEDPFTGVVSIRLAPISQASAIQRAGRAARQGPGRCLRLYSSAEYSRRRAYDAPEVLRLELAPLVLWCARLGVDPASLPYFDPPPASALAAAHALLLRMGALTQHRLTPDGEQMASLPLSPRLARVALTGMAMGVPADGLADALAVLENPQDAPPPPAHPTAGDSDLDEAVRLVARVPTWRHQSAELRGTLARLKRPAASTASPHALTAALLAGFSDRVGKRLPPLGAQAGPLPLAMAGGGGATLRAQSCVREATFLLCLAGHIERGPTGQMAIDLAVAIEAADLLARQDGYVVEEEQTRLSPGGRALRRSRLLYDGLSLLEHDGEEKDPLRRAEALRAAWRALPTEQATLALLMGRLQRRLRWTARVAASIASEGQRWLAASVDAAAHGVALRGERVSDVTSAAVWQEAVATLPAPLRAALAQHAPLEITTRAGRTLPVQWAEHSDPFVESYVQDFFGHDAPIALGPHQPGIAVHLWAPNRRPVQVTADLPNFWRVHYPVFRREWLRRYPKHVWPEDPTKASPPPRRSAAKRRTPSSAS